MANDAALLFTGGRVLVLDGPAREAQALLVRAGRVVAAGDRAELRAAAGSGAREIDLDGATALPGLIDTHPHLLHFGVLSEPLVDIGDARSHADIVERIAQRAEAEPAGEWIMATPVGEPHYFLRRSWRDLAEGELPDRAVLDRATAQHPVFVQAWAPVTPNVCAFNSAALERLDITRESPDRIENVWIEKDASGAPTGRLHGSVNNYYSNDPFMEGLLRQIPILQLDKTVPGVVRSMAAYNRLGVTTVYEGHAMSEAEIAVYGHLRETRQLTLRVLTALEAEAYGLPWSRPLSDAAFHTNLERALALESLEDDWLRHRGVTLSRGGPCWPGFLRMHAAYEGPYGEPTRGVTFVPAEREQMALEFCAERGLRLNFIGTGDRDHDEFLERAEAVAKRHPVAARRWILQHVYLLSERQAERYAALGFDVTTSMSFSWGKGDLIGARVGRHAWADLIPLRRMLDAGLCVACGTDWGPKNVFEQIQLAETHRFEGSGHCNRGPGQLVTRAEALAMWTRDAARVLGWAGIGTLAPGSHADLTLVDRDPLRCHLEELPETRVLATVVGGETVYAGGELATLPAGPEERGPL